MPNWPSLTPSPPKRAPRRFCREDPLGRYGSGEALLCTYLLHPSLSFLIDALSSFYKQLTVIFPSFHPPTSICFCWQVSNFGQPIAFNVSHDNELVAMAFAPGHHAPPAFLIGVDVMMVQAPTRGAEQGTASFLRTVGDTTLTDAEKHLLSSDVPENEALSRFYLIWTIKEAYTKAIGLGLGFDPSRIEYDLRTNTVAVDGVIAADWQFETSQVMLDDDKPYRITVAQFVGSGNGSGTVVPLAQRQIVCSGASSFVRKALHQLKELERDDAGNIATRYVN